MGLRYMANSSMAYLAKRIVTSLVKCLYQLLSRLPARSNRRYSHINQEQPWSRLLPSSPHHPCVPPGLLALVVGTQRIRNCGKCSFKNNSSERQEGARVKP